MGCGCLRCLSRECVSEWVTDCRYIQALNNTHTKQLNAEAAGSAHQSADIVAAEREGGSQPR